MMIYFTLFYLFFFFLHFLGLHEHTHSHSRRVIYLLIVNTSALHVIHTRLRHFDWLALPLLLLLLKIGCECVYYTNRDNLTYAVPHTRCNRHCRNWVNLEQCKAKICLFNNKHAAQLHFREQNKYLTFWMIQSTCMTNLYRTYLFPTVFLIEGNTDRREWKRGRKSE